MKVLFIHQNFPAQYRHIATILGQSPENELVAIAKRDDAKIPGVRVIKYAPKREAHKNIHHYLREMENHVLHGQEVTRVMSELRQQGFRPDIVCGHPGWGETLYVKDVFPKAALLTYCEFYYRGQGADVGFDPKEPPTLDTLCRVRTKNAHLLLSLEASDHGVVPTRWQWQQHPAELRGKLSIIHDGIRADIAKPEPAARLILPGGEVFAAGEEIVTYVARNLEPYRGFPSFMRAAGLILKRRPKTRILVVGADGVSYGGKRADGRGYREALLEEVDLDRSRIHFLGHLPYDKFIQVLQVSAAHIYLTIPFVLSWSMLEAMSAGCLVVGSNTPPVAEVIRDGENGLLVDFFDPESIAAGVNRVLDHPDRMAGPRRKARQTIMAKYELNRCVEQQIALIRQVAGGQVKVARPSPKTRPKTRRR
jgi:glycosyltransferase involved in cell wall biosynthesis